MLKRVRHLVAFACFTAALFSSAAVHAASLEKIEVGSQLGEPFFAEVPLKLEADESVSRLFVEIAAPADYKIFEVYRDPVLSTIRADVTSDKRGARVKLSSRTSIKAPFFNLVLKVRYGRVAHFKKFAVFLEPPKSIQTAALKAPQPTIQATEQGGAVDSAPVVDTSDTNSSSETSATAEQSASYEGWARTNRYGPIVYGDMLSTVAARLRVDKRYKPTQVMAALFEKNKGKFDRENMNMLKAGSFLEVPTAAEVEQRSSKEAYRLFAQHEKQWKELTQKPRYAAVEEAQRTRYSKRVSIGGQATGSAAAPVLTPAIAQKQDSSTEPTTTASQSNSDAGSVAAVASESGSLASTVTDKQQAEVDKAEANPLLTELQAKNEALQQQLLANQKSIEAMNAKLDGVATAATAASNARIEKLEVLLVRMQAELEKSNNQAAVQQQGPDWVVWLLAALVVILLGAVAVLMRREPVHPSEVAKDVDKIEPAEEAVAIADEATATTEAPTNEKAEETEEDVFDSISSFADDLTDTDTAEMEPFDASLLDEDPDPNVDYLSEADVYVRYGMDDEALHQLNLALRLQPDSLNAHIKKAQLLRRTGNLTAFNESKVEAGSELGAADLEQFNVALHEVSSDTQDETLEQSSEQSETSLPGEADDVSAVLLLDGAEDDANDLLVDSAEDDGIDFDLSDIEVPDQQHPVSQEPAMEEMDWLHDDSFAATSESSVESASVDADEDGVTQMFDNLMGEFSDDDQVLSLAGSDVDSVESSLSETNPEVSAEDTLDLESAGATQELDNLLSEFTDQDEALVDAAVSDSSLDAADRTLVISDELADIQDLDHLLGDFADDDEVFNFAAESNELDASVFEQAETAVSQQTEEDETAFGATQHLDVLMSEFSEKEGADSESAGMIDDLSSQSDHMSASTDAISIEENHDATQELNHLLGEFSAGEDEAAPDNPLAAAEYDASTTIEMDHDATQELDNLLSEFAADEEDDKPVEDTAETHKEIGFDDNHGATQELDQLLSEFSDDDEDDSNKKG